MKNLYVVWHCAINPLFVIENIPLFMFYWSITSAVS